MYADDSTRMGPSDLRCTWRSDYTRFARKMMARMTRTVTRSPPPMYMVSPFPVDGVDPEDVPATTPFQPLSCASIPSGHDAHARPAPTPDGADAQRCSPGACASRHKISALTEVALWRGSTDSRAESIDTSASPRPRSACGPGMFTCAPNDRVRPGGTRFVTSTVIIGERGTRRNVNGESAPPASRPLFKSSDATRTMSCSCGSVTPARCSTSDISERRARRSMLPGPRVRSQTPLPGASFDSRRSWPCDSRSTGQQ